MKIMKYGILIILVALMVSCNVYVWDSYAMVRVQNFSSRNIYNIELEEYELGALVRNGSTLYYSIETGVDSIRLKLSPFSEWKEYFLEERMDKDHRYSVVIFDNDSYFGDEFEIHVFQDYEVEDSLTPTPAPVVTTTPVPEMTLSPDPLYLIEMDVDGKYYSMTTSYFFKFNSMYDDYELLGWNDQFYLMITLPEDVDSSQVFLGNSQTIPEGFDFGLYVSGDDQYYLLGARDFMFALVEWDYGGKQINGFFGGDLYIKETGEYVTISDGVIYRID